MFLEHQLSIDYIQSKFNIVKMLFTVVIKNSVCIIQWTELHKQIELDWKQTMIINIMHQYLET